MDLEPVPMDPPDWLAGEPQGPAPTPPSGSFFSLRTKLAAAGLAAATVGAAAFALGTMDGPASTVRIQPAVASSSAGSGPGGPGHRAGDWHPGFGGSIAGSVGTVTSPDFTVVLPVHTRKKPSSAAGPDSAAATPPTATTSTPPTVTVDTSKTTAYEDIKNGPVSDAAVGDRIVAMGARATDGDLAATVIRILPPPPAARTGPAAPTASTGTIKTDAATTPPPSLLTKAPFVIGTVATNDGSTITVTTRGGAIQTITTSSATVVVETAGGSFGDIAPGEQVTVRGRRQADGTIDATEVTLVLTGTKDAGSLGTGMGMPAVGFGHRPGSEEPPGGGKGDNHAGTNTTSTTTTSLTA